MKINKLLAVFLLALLVPLNAGAKVSSKEIYRQFRNPSENRYKPFVRWWWNGDAVEAGELVRELHLLKEAGIGGVEINPISMPSTADRGNHKTLKWLSPEWIDMLKLVFDEAEKIGMTCDLIVGSGWPFGSESLSREERSSVLVTKAFKVEGGEHVDISAFKVFGDIDPQVTIKNPRRVPSVVSIQICPDPVSDFSQVVDITDYLKGGEFIYDVPEGGPYQIYFLVRFDSFACVINGAPGAAGSMLNHMNEKVVRTYLDKMSDTIESRIGPLSNHIRALFVDSMELEGCNWTDDFREEFIKRRGYDVMPWLAFTMFETGRLGDVTNYDFGAKQGEAFKNKVDRVRYDFELTKAELLDERFSATFRQWCRDKGVKARAQTYGRGFFPLETALGYDLPEGESWTTNWLRHKLGEEMGDEDYRRGRGYTMINKYISSAANLQGKRIVSAEEMTNTYLVFNTSLELLKIGSDMSAFSGITHSIWHGFNYSPPDVTFPGWVQYGSYYNENNTWWPYWKYLNEYRARMSSILQNADMHTDIAILPPNADLWTEMGVQTEPFPRDLNVTYTSLVWEAVHKNGGGADYVSERILKDAKVKGGKLCYGPKQYGDVILVNVKRTTQEALDKLLELVEKGGRVFCIETYPQTSLGLENWEKRDEIFRATVEKLKKYPDKFILLEKPADNKFLEWYADVMNKYSLPHTVKISNPDRFLLQNRYTGDDKSDYFLFANVNLTEKKSTDISFPKPVTRGKKASIYDPASGEVYSVELKNQLLHLDLEPAQTLFVVFNKMGGGKKWSPIPCGGEEELTINDWQASLHHSCEAWTKTMSMPQLKDLKDTEYVNFMGDITYTATVKIDGKNLPKYLNLGEVHEIAELKINGKPLGVRWFGNRTYDVSGLLKAGYNVIEVKVTTLMGNYMQTLKDNKVAERQVIKRKHPIKSMGLLGPVKLYK